MIQDSQAFRGWVFLFCLVPLTSEPGNPHGGPRTFYGGDGRLRIRLSGRKTLRYPKALEQLYSTPRL